MKNYKIGIDLAIGEDESCLVVFKGNKVVAKTIDKKIIKFFSKLNN